MTALEPESNVVNLPPVLLLALSLSLSPSVFVSVVSVAVTDCCLSIGLV